MILSKEYITHTVQDFFKDKPVKKVFLFGSYARGEANEKSDVDLFLVLDEDRKVNFFEMAGMWQDFQDTLKKNVDLVHQHPFLKERFTNYINKDKILLFEK